MDFNFIKDEYMQNSLQYGCDYLNKHDLWWFFKNNKFNSMVYHDEPTKIIINSIHPHFENLTIEMDKKSIHSGASMGQALRYLEYIAKYGYDQFKDKLS